MLIFNNKFNSSYIDQVDDQSVLVGKATLLQLYEFKEVLNIHFSIFAIIIGVSVIIISY
jgi:hypothetical protein